MLIRLHTEPTSQLIMSDQINNAEMVERFMVLAHPLIGKQ